MEELKYKTASGLLGLDHEAPLSSTAIAVIGCGGKTSLINSLALELGAYNKVLITPTTKIFPPSLPGIDVKGIWDGKTGKLCALPYSELCAAKEEYDVLLMEADGSRQRPCKGWRDNEPVIPKFSTHTVGIVTLDGIGSPADENTVLNLDEFCRLTGLSPGELIHDSHLISMVCGEGGMFSKGVGIKSLFLNKIENKKSEKRAKSWLLALREGFPGAFSHLAYGSARHNRWREII